MQSLKIRDMAEHEKPVEKLLSYGAEMLSDAELLAIILRTGTSNMSVIELSQLILNAHPIYKGLSGLNYRYANDLMDIPGVGKVKACQILALNEISRRMATERTSPELTLSSSESVANYFMEQVRYQTKERVYALFCSSSCGLIHKVMITNRELFKEALKANAASIVLIHNHPSGNPEPSNVDLVITKRIKKMGDDMGIPLLDHIIIGDGVYYSMHEKGLL